MRIRDATLADLEFIAGANLALAQETEGQALDPALLLPGVRAVFEEPGRGHYYLAEIDGRPVGQLMTTYEWSDWRNGVFLWIQSVYVLPEYRGSGALKALYGHLLELARAESHICGIRLYVDRSNARALQVYERLGMHRSNYDVMETVFRGPESHG
ncbi:MAG: GNAT family N-acetyltransferase [Burkholderiales bacterium]